MTFPAMQDGDHIALAKIEMLANQINDLLLDEVAGSGKPWKAPGGNAVGAMTALGAAAIEDMRRQQEALATPVLVDRAVARLDGMTDWTHWPPNHGPNSLYTRITRKLARRGDDQEGAELV